MEKPGLTPNEAKARRIAAVAGCPAGKARHPQRELRCGLFLTSLPWLVLLLIWWLAR
jgi:hypothetical protein